MDYRTETNSHKQTVIITANQLVKRYTPPPAGSRPWIKAYTWARDLVSASQYVTLLHLAELNGDLYPPEIAVKLIAHRRHLSERMIRYHLQALEKAKIIRIERCKISWCRNTPNRYILLDINGEPLHLIHARNCREKIKTELNTNTPPPERRIVPVSRTREGDHPPEMRERYEKVGRVMAENRTLRAMVRSRQHSTPEYFAYRANVGVYDPHKNDVNAPQCDAEASEWAEAYQKRQRERQAQAQAQIAAANEQRQREQAERDRRRQAEAAEPISAELRAEIDRIKRKQATAEAERERQDEQAAQAAELERAAWHKRQVERAAKMAAAESPKNE
jgi:hypothetical protein